MEAYRIARQEHLIPPTMEQPEYNMFCRNRIEQEYIPLYRDIGLGTTIYSPLASGLLTGKYNHNMPQDTRASLAGYEWLRPKFTGNDGKTRIKKVRKLAPIAEELGVSLPQLALAWCLKNPHVSSVITGGSKPQHVEQNMKALELLPELTLDIMKQIDAILVNKPKPPQDFR
jgi:aryl-alcohol dehydrogenase-like predicted oxidoreductase